MNTRVDLCILDKLWDDDRIFFRHGAGLSQVHLEVFLWVSNVHCRSTQHIRWTDQTRKTHLLTKLPHCLHIQPIIRRATIAATTDKIHTHTQPFNGPFSGTTICKQSAPRSRQITTPAPHRMPFLPPNQQRQSTEGTIVIDSIVIVIINKSYYCNIKKKLVINRTYIGCEQSTVVSTGNLDWGEEYQTVPYTDTSAPCSLVRPFLWPASWPETRYQTTYEIRHVPLTAFAVPENFCVLILLAYTMHLAALQLYAMWIHYCHCRRCTQTAKRPQCPLVLSTLAAESGARRCPACVRTCSDSRQCQCCLATYPTPSPATHTCTCRQTECQTHAAVMVE